MTDYPIESKHLDTISGLDITLEVRYDNQTDARDFDCYTPSQVTAWLERKWLYLSLRVTASAEGLTLGEAWTSGIEAGNFPLTDENDNLEKWQWYWFDYVVEDWADTISDLQSEAIENATATFAKIEERLGK